ncbi:MAG: SCP-like extracellular [Hyphomicrobiales bacterium]|nr:SCP-like extracellular [Hyphomicrobiales bacterium]
MVRLSCVFALALGLTSTAFTSSAMAGPADSGAASMVTRFRAAYGLGPVRIDPALTRAAERQAQAMAAAGVLSHDVGGSFGSRMSAAGLGHVPAAENVGVGHRSMQAAIESWQRSPGHQANLLMRGVTRIGVARVDAPGRPYWAMVLAEDESSRTASSGFGFGLMPFGVGFVIGR